MWHNHKKEIEIMRVHGHLTKSPYLCDYVFNLVINICLSINSISLFVSINVIFQKEVSERHQVFFFELHNHLVAQSKRHQLRGRKKTTTEKHD